MEKKEKEYFDLSIEELQSIASWASDCASRALPIYENGEIHDARPRDAIDGAREFASTGKRTNRLRKLAMDAHRASLEAKDPAASAAARSASLAAASAYTHPFRDINQSKHILGPAVFSALAVELNCGDDHEVGEAEIGLAIASASSAIMRVLDEMPAQKVGTKRLDQLYYLLDTGMRGNSK